MAKILLVDDEPGVRHVLVGLLRQKNHVVTPAAHVQQAHRILQNESFDLLISDIQMQPISGLELLKFARIACPNMAVVMMTAHGCAEQAMESIHEGSFDYVIKPFSSEKLFSTIRRALESRCIPTNLIDAPFPSKPIGTNQFHRITRLSPFSTVPLPTTAFEEEWSFPET